MSLSRIISKNICQLQLLPQLNSINNVTQRQYADLILDASPPTDQEWEEYKIKFSKKYNDADHESSKRAIFTEGKKKVAEHNQKHEKGEVTYTMGINQFTDMTEDEMKCMRGYRPR